MGHRVDMYQDVDAYYDELGDAKPGQWRVGTGWLSSGGRPGIIWCHNPEGVFAATQCGAMMTNGTDEERFRFLQSHLLLGLYPSIPFKDNDHMLAPAPRADQVYQRYGSLFTALHGKRFATWPHAILLRSVADPVSLAERVPTGSSAGTSQAQQPLPQVNLFEMAPFGSGIYAAVVAFAPGRAINATILLSNVPALKSIYTAASSSSHADHSGRNGVQAAVACSAVAVLPGRDGQGTPAQVVAVPGVSDAVEVVTPLQDGCAVVKVTCR
mmetsp:Transcript_11573/g.22016  ORF Transcript_11573/g.22016 Transcript_11573/m.22016 type:complete len:269 (+) Transcript_11573:393-1199(+)